MRSSKRVVSLFQVVVVHPIETISQNLGRFGSHLERMGISDQLARKKPATEEGTQGSRSDVFEDDRSISFSFVNSEFPQFLLQTLAVQTNLSCCATDISAIFLKSCGDIAPLKLAFRFFIGQRKEHFNTGVILVYGSHQLSICSAVQEFLW